MFPRILVTHVLLHGFKAAAHVIQLLLGYLSRPSPLSFPLKSPAGDRSLRALDEEEVQLLQICEAVIELLGLLHESSRLAACEQQCASARP